MGEIPTRYSFSPFFYFFGAFAKLLNIPCAITAHTLLPLILLPMTFLVYWLWSREFFPDKLQYRSLFMTFVTILFCFGYFSSKSSTAFTLIRLWQGKAVLCAIGIPYLLYVLYKIWKDGLSVGRFLLLLAASTACCLMSSMGVITALIMVGIGWILRMMHGRKLTDLLMLLCAAPNLVICVIYTFF